MPKDNLYKALHILTGRQRLIIYFRFWNEMTILEISKMLHLSWEQTDAALNLALKQMKKHLLEQTGITRKKLIA